MRYTWLTVPLLVLAACSETQIVGGGSLVSAPSNLLYTVEASGTPGAPSGVLLQWDFDNDPNLSSWNVYSRGSTTESYRLRATTTSNSFHDEGIPHLQYYVTAADIDGNESGPSNVVTVDERLVLDKPTTLTSTTLNAAIALTWSDNAFLGNPSRFKIYRVYSTSYDLDQNLCGDTWFLEGTTVSPEFIVCSADQRSIPLLWGFRREYRGVRESMVTDPFGYSAARRPECGDLRSSGSGCGQWFPVLARFERQWDGPGGGVGIDPRWVFHTQRLFGRAGRRRCALSHPGAQRDRRAAVTGAAPVADLTSIDVAPVGPYGRRAGSRPCQGGDTSSRPTGATASIATGRFGSPTSDRTS